MHSLQYALIYCGGHNNIKMHLRFQLLWIIILIVRRDARILGYLAALSTHQHPEHPQYNVWHRTHPGILSVLDFELEYTWVESDGHHETPPM